MRNVSSLFRRVHELVAMLLSFIVDAGCYLGLCLRPSLTLAAENLFLRRQPALYRERGIKARQVEAIIGPNHPGCLPPATTICSLSAR